MFGPLRLGFLKLRKPQRRKPARRHVHCLSRHLKCLFKELVEHRRIYVKPRQSILERKRNLVASLSTTAYVTQAKHLSIDWRMDDKVVDIVICREIKSKLLKILIDYIVVDWPD